MTTAVIDLCGEALCMNAARYRIAHPRLRGQKVFLCEACAQKRKTELHEVGAALEPIEGTQQTA